jgi:hypothetical protein
VCDTAWFGTLELKIRGGGGQKWRHWYSLTTVHMASDSHGLTVIQQLSTKLHSRYNGNNRLTRTTTTNEILCSESNCREPTLQLGTANNPDWFSFRCSAALEAGTACRLDTVSKLKPTDAHRYMKVHYAHRTSPHVFRPLTRPSLAKCVTNNTCVEVLQESSSCSILSRPAYKAAVLSTNTCSSTHAHAHTTPAGSNRHAHIHFVLTRSGKYAHLSF